MIGFGLDGLRVDSRGVLAWICEYGDGLYDFRWTPVSLHGLAVVRFAAWTCRVKYLLGFWNGFTLSNYRMLRIVSKHRFC